MEALGQLGSPMWQSRYWIEGKATGGLYLSEEGVVDLFGDADFDGFHHLAGGDDGAAEGLR